MKTRSALVASAAAAMFVAGLAGAAQAEEQKPGGEAKIKCEGVNSCKGHSECKSAQNSCKGQNSCSGKGFMMMSKAECDAAKAKAAEKSKKM